MLERPSDRSGAPTRPRPPRVTIGDARCLPPQPWAGAPPTSPSTVTIKHAAAGASAALRPSLRAPSMRHGYAISRRRARPRLQEHYRPHPLTYQRPAPRPLPPSAFRLKGVGFDRPARIWPALRAASDDVCHALSVRGVWIEAWRLSPSVKTGGCTVSLNGRSSRQSSAWMRSQSNKK